MYRNKHAIYSNYAPNKINCDPTIHVHRRFRFNSHVQRTHTQIHIYTQGEDERQRE